MPILDNQVERYLHDLRPARSEVMADMEEVARRDSVPIVHWETGRFLATLSRAFDPNVLEVGTAIGYSTLHIAEPLSAGRVVTLEIDPDRARLARDFWSRAGVAERIELIEGDALERIPELSGPYDLLFVDAAKGQYREYIRLAEPLLTERALLVIDNLLVGGEVALPGGASGARSAESIASARELNPELLGSDAWLGSVLPIGDGVGSPRVVEAGRGRLVGARAKVVIRPHEMAPARLRPRAARDRPPAVARTRLLSRVDRPLRASQRSLHG